MREFRQLTLRLVDDEALLCLMTDMSLLEDCVRAGFPSPADDYPVQDLDLNQHLIRHPDSTYFLKVLGDSMLGAGIKSGDILIVDRSIEPTNDKVVVACFIIPTSELCRVESF